LTSEAGQAKSAYPMASYDTSDIRKGLKVMIDGSPFTVVEFQFVKPGKGAAFTRTKLKNLLTGGVIDRNLRSGEKLEPANVETKSMQYLYKEGDSYVFMDTSTYDQVQIPHETIGDDSNFMPEQIIVEVLFFNDRAVGVTLPNFIEQKVMGTEPGFRGDTATGVTKPARISTGASINVPLFINEGDTIKIDTRNGEYLERVARA
jgi:elongation factor P